MPPVWFSAREYFRHMYIFAAQIFFAAHAKSGFKTRGRQECRPYETI
jgi:hypothetical protein